jgi:hypothetical protein
MEREPLLHCHQALTSSFVAGSEWMAIRLGQEMPKLKGIKRKYIHLENFL